MLSQISAGTLTFSDILVTSVGLALKDQCDWAIRPLTECCGSLAGISDRQLKKF